MVDRRAAGLRRPAVGNGGNIKDGRIKDGRIKDGRDPDPMAWLPGDAGPGRGVRQHGGGGQARRQQHKPHQHRADSWTETSRAKTSRAKTSRRRVLAVGSGNAGRGHTQTSAHGTFWRERQPQCGYATSEKENSHAQQLAKVKGQVT